MTTIHDDRPHPVPPFASLRWKENYFLIVMDRASDVYGVIHVNNEPLFAHSRFTMNLSIQGKPFRYANEVAFPTDFALAEALSDGVLTLRFVSPHKRMDILYRGDDMSADIVFEARRPTFDYIACKSAAPHMPSFQEIMTLGLNLPYNHQQQSMTAKGQITVKGGKTITLDGLGYRDHSWCMRADVLTARHVWTGLNFPERAFGIKVLETTHRPGVWAKEGYVSDADGERALTAIDVSQHGDKGGWPERVTLAVRDVLGKNFTIDADVAHRHADVQLVSEKATAAQTYRIIETFCPLTIRETSETGIGLVEIGRHPSLDKA